VQSFIGERVVPLVQELGLPWRRDAMGNLLIEFGPERADKSLMLMAYAMTHPASRMKDPFAGELIGSGSSAFVRGRGVGHVTELDWWQEADVGGGGGALRAACTPAQHFSGRMLIDRGETLWCGWALAIQGRRVFFAGDTGYHPEFALIAERCGPFDLALLPIGAYEPRWFMRYLHMNPEEAVQAFRGLGAQVMVPIHWGTFKLTDEAMDEPPVRARAAFAAANLPIERYRQLAHGETLCV